jgi:hypothetical protein
VSSLLPVMVGFVHTYGALPLGSLASDLRVIDLLVQSGCVINLYHAKVATTCCIVDQSPSCYGPSWDNPGHRFVVDWDLRNESKQPPTSCRDGGQTNATSYSLAGGLPGLSRKVPTTIDIMCNTTWNFASHLIYSRR